MADMPQAAPVPNKPPLHLRGGYLVVAPPEDPLQALFCVPAVRALRNGRPNGTLAVVTPQRNQAIWQRVAGINHLVTYPPKATSAVIAGLIKETGVTYESSFAWTADVPASAFAKLKIQQRLGPSVPGLTGKLTDVVEVAQAVGPPGHELRKYLLPLQRLGIDTLVPKNFPVPELPDRPTPAVIGLAPGSDFGEAYEWSCEPLIEVAVSLHERHRVDLVVLNLPGTEEKARLLADGLTARLGSAVQDCVGRFTIEELLEALPHLSVLVCSDGTLAHLAALVGLPTAVIFGPGDEAGNRPQGRMHRTINAYVECAGCRRRKCPLDHRCMNEVTPAMVMQVVEEIMA